jgi:DNA-binding HxlR family transcriptional regulator
MRLDDFSHLECPLARALGVVGEWWSLLVVRDLFYGIDSFDDLQDDLGISRKVLTHRLRKLEDRHVLQRELYSEHPPRYRYRLTAKGKDLYPVIIALVAWADAWESPDGPVLHLLHGQPPHTLRPRLICSECGEAIRPSAVRPIPGPGALRRHALPKPLRPRP